MLGVLATALLLLGNRPHLPPIPAFIIVHTEDGSLKKPVPEKPALTVMASTWEAPLPGSPDVSKLKGVQVAVYMTSTWWDWAKAGKPLDEVPLTRADLTGTIYPAQQGQPALIQVAADPRSEAALYRLSPRAVAALQTYGVPMGSY